MTRGLGRVHVLPLQTRVPEIADVYKNNFEIVVQNRSYNCKKTRSAPSFYYTCHRAVKMEAIGIKNFASYFFSPHHGQRKKSTDASSGHANHTLLAERSRRPQQRIIAVVVRLPLDGGETRLPLGRLGSLLRQRR